jgi:rubredoxin
LVLGREENYPGKPTSGEQRSQERHMQAYLVEWECPSCGRKQSFRRVVSEEDGWPNKFEDLQCKNEDCGQVQDVPFRVCTATPVEGMEEI